MLKCLLSIALVVGSQGVLGQGIFDSITNQIMKSMSDPVPRKEDFVLHDSIATKLGLYVNIVCRVVLINGNTVEGFIDFGSGIPDGFYFENGEFSNWKAKPIYNFDFYFRKFTRQSEQEYTIFREYGYDDTVYVKSVKHLYYLNEQGKSRIGTEAKQQIIKSDGGLSLTISHDIKCEIHYKLKDSLVLYQELAPDTYIRESVGLRKIRVKISEIKSLEFLVEPDRQWLDIISKNRTEAEEINKEKNDKSEFHEKSNWFHVIVKDGSLMKHFQKCYDLALEASGEFPIH